jgi:hypothetical protein
MYRAGSASRDATAVLCAREAEFITEHPKQRSVGLDVDIVDDAIHN